MNERVIDVSELDDAPAGRAAPVYWGMWGLITVEATVFASLITTYMYLRLNADAWPPDGVDPPELLLPTVNTAILLGSMPFVYFADRAVRRGDQRRLALWLLASTAAAIAFLSIKVVEYTHLGFRWDSHAYGSIVWTLSGFHAAHVTALVLKTVVLIAWAIRGLATRERLVAVEVNGLYWYFVAAVWLPIYVVLYLVPRWLP